MGTHFIVQGRGLAFDPQGGVHPPSFPPPPPMCELNKVFKLQYISQVKTVFMFSGRD